MSAVVVNKSTFEVVYNPNTPDYPATEWLHGPNGLQTLISNKVSKRYWKVVDDSLEEMLQSEKDDLVVTTVDLENKSLEITSAYNAEAYDQVQVGARWYNADPKTQQNLISLVAMEDSTIYPYSDTEQGTNTWVTHTHEDLVGIARAIRDRNIVLYVKLESLKGAINAATNLSELNAVAW